MMTKTTSTAMQMAKHNSSSIVLTRNNSSGQINNTKDTMSNKIITNTTTIITSSTMIKITKVTNINRTTHNNIKITGTRLNNITIKTNSKTKLIIQATITKIHTKTNKPTTLTIPINTNSTSTMMKTE